MDPILDTYDWEQAFSYATGFVREDVKTITGMAEGENDGASWIIYGKLKSGDWFYLCAGCDYTGWDCSADGHSAMDSTRGRIERFALTDEDRGRLGVKLKKVTKKKVTKKKVTKKPSLTELRDTALAQVRERDSRKERMEKLLTRIASLFKPSPVIFWFDQHRWEAFEELRGAETSDAWDPEVHPYTEQAVPEWRDFLKCLTTRIEEQAPIGAMNIDFADSVVVFDALDDTKDVVITVRGGAFVVKTYWAEGWEITSKEYGHPKTAAELENLLKEMGCSMA